MFLKKIKKKKNLFQINCFYYFHIVLTYFDILKKKKNIIRYISK